MTSTSFFAQACYRGERHAELEQEYFKVYYPLDERMPRLRRLPDSRIVQSDELLTEEEMKTSPVYNELLPRADSRNGLVTRFDWPDGSRIVWTVGDPADAAGWHASATPSPASGSPQAGPLQGGSSAPVSSTFPRLSAKRPFDKVRAAAQAD